MNEELRVEPYTRAFHAWQLPLARAFAWTLFTLLGPFRVNRASRVPKGGGLLILSNHLSDCDPVAVQLACPRPVRFMAKRELFQMPVVRFWLRWLKAFPVNRGAPDKASIRHAVELLKAGECVCVFPEGQLSESGELQELKPGIALIVRMAGVPVICLSLKHTNRIVPYGSYVPRPALRWVEATWGDPHQFNKDADTEVVREWAEKELRALAEPAGAPKLREAPTGAGAR